MRQPARLAAAMRHFPPAMRPRPQPTGLACGRAALAPGLLPRPPPPDHPKSGCNIFLCGSLLGLPQAKRVCPPALRARHLPHCGRVTSRPAGTSPARPARASHPALRARHLPALRAHHLPPLHSNPGLLPHPPTPRYQHALITFRCCNHFCVIVSVVAGSLLRARHPQRCRWRSSAIRVCYIDVHE